MKRSWLWIGAAFALLGMGGCGAPGGGEGPTASDGKESKIDAPMAPTGDGELKGDLEVQAFKGGYGIDFYQQCGAEFGKLHPQLKIKVDGNPRVWMQLQPRFIAGNPPDLAFPGWDMDHWALAEEGQLMDLTDALKSKPFEGEGTWGDTFDPKILKLGQLEGRQFVLPYYVMQHGWWYDPGLFEKHGWTPPKTYSELLTLCEQIRAAGIAPITFQGQYPYYMFNGMVLPWACSIGGIEAVNAAQNLEPGAWKSPAILQAAKMIDELNKKGYFQKGAVAMSHTESQQEFLQGKAAMIPCGTWLESEMKNVMPPGATIRFFLPPVVEGGKGDTTALIIGIEPWMVPTDAKNPNAAVALYKYMTCLSSAKKFVQQKGTLMSIKGSDQVELPETLKAPAEAMAKSGTLWAVQYSTWYKEFAKEQQNALTAMLNGEATPEQFCDRMEAAAEKTRQDTTIKKHKL